MAIAYDQIGVDYDQSAVTYDGISVGRATARPTVNALTVSTLTVNAQATSASVAD